MDLNLYVIYDVKANLFFEPMCGHSLGTIARTLRETVKAPVILNHLADYELWYVGKFNTLSGRVIVGDNSPVKLLVLNEIFEEKVNEIQDTI